MINIGVLISGRGSNLQAIIDSVEKGEVLAKVALVISNKPEAYGLERAKKHRIPTAVFEPDNFTNKNDYESEIVKALKENKVDLVCLAGYMRIVGHVLLDAYKGKTINIHPALLPAFPGPHGSKQALDYGAKISGVTVHFVDEGCDTGPIILQQAVPVLEGDTEEALSARILEEEHKIYPQAIRLFAEGRLRIEGRKVKIM
ncbi:phosphoribosylglycinamide formyltransferase [candidate division WOR-1 bacterium RIFCSPLOWO2_02_FULL_46_20]|uniref:Phosphoribosylglycinamide formyltransferase n=1 Tax=candidate division WOR-1 bacterium RIFCSPLOWO2_02_FULL_46_20 TaxID=1802567 RepID=A0A1F4RF43_UNCSA|nr:MAG: phosphoribosylglycinamide formyltransferase [candidate division WOR-1 bacterium RIFCSPHIGHO2_02_FULL_45_12]OGC06802.1 MAG: phosphoribosylglycinamide formyltransferase [candidate division WOR-1 bacterium RIFCSPLOWO2_02_FULL_46_20]